MESVAEREARIERLAGERAVRRVAGEDRTLTIVNEPLPWTTAGAPVTVRESLQLADVWAIVSTIARTAAMMPAVLYRRVGDGRQRVSEGGGADLLRRPSPGMASSAFVASAALSTALYGELFVAKHRRPDGQIASLSLLSPDAVEVSLLASGEPLYVWNFAGKRHELSRADVAHGMLFSIDGLRGASPVRMCREGLSLNRALAQQAAATLANSGVPRGILTVPPGPPGEELMSKLAADWQSTHGGPANSGRVAIVSGEITWQGVGMTAADQEFTEQRKLSTVELCRIWGMPPAAIGAPTGESMTYSNLEAERTSLVRSCVTSYVMPLEEALSLDEEIAPGDQYVELLSEGVMRGDLTARYSAYATALSAGFLTVDEVRRRENLEPLDESERPPLAAVPNQQKAAHGGGGR